MSTNNETPVFWNCPWPGCDGQVMADASEVELTKRMFDHWEAHDPSQNALVTDERTKNA